MLCAISGESPQEPVASKKSGTVFEKRLIETYISEHGRDPVTNEELSVDDLIPLRNARVVRPRPPTLTSIPSLLSVFQNEWDAIALETYELQQQMRQLKQELSTALYNHDAAVRVIGRITKERDEAREALAKLSVTDRRSLSAAAAAVGASSQTEAAGTNGEAMQVDGASLPAEHAAKVTATLEKLTKTRRKRPLPDGWATVEQIQNFKLAKKPTKMVPPGSNALAVDKDGELALIGGSDGTGCIYSVSKSSTIRVFSAGDARITSVATGDFETRLRSILALSTGHVKVFDGEQEVMAFSAHAGAATGVALHPCGDILGSVGEDKSFAFYDLLDKKLLTQVYTNSLLTCCQFHPDGAFLAAGGADNSIKFFDVKTGLQLSTLELSGPPQSMSFSENGTWLAAVVKGSSTVTIFHIGKMTIVHTIEFGSQIDSVAWDYTGQFLAAAGPQVVAVHHYDKASKKWTEPLTKAAKAAAVNWESKALGLVLLTTDGALTTLH